MKRTIITIAALGMLAFSAVALGQQQQPRNITIAPNTATVKFGGTVTLSGKLTGPNNSGRNVTVQKDQFPIDAFTDAGTTQTNASGDWTFADKPAANTRYRARSGSAESKTVDVMVRPAISLRLSDRTPEKGQRVRFFGRLCPEHDGMSVALQRRVAPNQWRTVKTTTLQDIPGETCSSYSTRRRVNRDSRFRVHWGGDADHVAGNSRSRRVDVHL
jgi:hypothetical protein